MAVCELHVKPLRSLRALPAMPLHSLRGDARRLDLLRLAASSSVARASAASTRAARSVAPPARVSTRATTACRSSSPSRRPDGSLSELVALGSRFGERRARHPPGGRAPRRRRLRVLISRRSSSSMSSSALASAVVARRSQSFSSSASRAATRSDIDESSRCRSADLVHRLGERGSAREAPDAIAPRCPRRRDRPRRALAGSSRKPPTRRVLPTPRLRRSTPPSPRTQHQLAPRALRFESLVPAIRGRTTRCEHRSRDRGEARRHPAAQTGDRPTSASRGGYPRTKKGSPGAAGIAFHLEDVPQPEQERLICREVVTCLERGGHLERVSDRDHEPCGRSGPDQRLLPERDKPADPRILDHEERSVAVLVLQQIDEPVLVALRNGRTKPRLRNRIGIGPRHARATSAASRAPA